MPPRPRAERNPVGHDAEDGVIGGHVGDQCCAGIPAGIGGEQAVEVGQQQEHVGADEVGDERGEPVVVAEADLVVGHGVALVHDRHAAQVEQAYQRLAGVEVLAPVHEVVGHHQHLGGDGVVVGQRARPRRHHPRLAQGEGLQRGRSAGRCCRPSAATPADTVEADDHDLVAVALGRRPPAGTARPPWSRRPGPARRSATRCRSSRSPGPRLRRPARTRS
jgi:hypothetical protein